jgi:hypothetical protein
MEKVNNIKDTKDFYDKKSTKDGNYAIAYSLLILADEINKFNVLLRNMYENDGIDNPNES